MIVPKRGKFVLHIKSQEDWDDVVDQLNPGMHTSRREWKDYYRVYEKKSGSGMTVIDGKIDGYSNMDFFLDKDNGYERNGYVFIELEPGGYSHRYGSPNYEAVPAETEYIEL